MVRGLLENITGGGVGSFLFFTDKIWVPLSEDWQNLGTPPPRIDRIWVPPSEN